MEDKIVNVINEMADVLNIAQLRKLQEVTAALIFGNCRTLSRAVPIENYSVNDMLHFHVFCLKKGDIKVL